MKKNKKILISSLIIGAFLGITLFNSQIFNVSAEDKEEESTVWDWEEHNEAMQGHMGRMHGKINQFRGTDDEPSDNEERDEERDLWEDRHNRMWEFRNENTSESNDDQSPNTDRFFGNMKNRMRGFSTSSFDDMFERMQEMHGSFGGRNSMMNGDLDEQIDDSDNEGTDNSNGQGFMNRFNFFNSN